MIEEYLERIVNNRYGKFIPIIGYFIHNEQLRQDNDDKNYDISNINLGIALYHLVSTLGMLYGLEKLLD